MRIVLPAGGWAPRFCSSLPAARWSSVAVARPVGSLRHRSRLFSASLPGDCYAANLRPCWSVINSGMAAAKTGLLIR
jgi:hypothetical protein